MCGIDLHFQNIIPYRVYSCFIHRQIINILHMSSRRFLAKTHNALHHIILYQTKLSLLLHFIAGGNNPLYGFGCITCLYYYIRSMSILKSGLNEGESSDSIKGEAIIGVSFTAGSGVGFPAAFSFSSAV